MSTRYHEDELQTNKMPQNHGLSLKQGMGNRGIRESGIRESGNPGIGESGNRGIRESGNPGIGESGNPGIGESGNRGIRESGNPGIGESGNHKLNNIFIAAERASLKRASAAAVLIYAVGGIYIKLLRRIALW